MNDDILLPHYLCVNKTNCKQKQIFKALLLGCKQCEIILKIFKNKGIHTKVMHTVHRFIRVGTELLYELPQELAGCIKSCVRIREASKFIGVRENF